MASELNCDSCKVQAESRYDAYYTSESGAQRLHNLPHHRCRSEWFRSIAQDRICPICPGSIKVTSVQGIPLDRAVGSDPEDLPEDGSFPSFDEGKEAREEVARATDSDMMNYASDATGFQDFAHEDDSPPPNDDFTTTEDP